jgi:hypothetical protein
VSGTATLGGGAGLTAGEGVVVVAGETFGGNVAAVLTAFVTVGASTPADVGIAVFVAGSGEGRVSVTVRRATAVSPGNTVSIAVADDPVDAVPSTRREIAYPTAMSAAMATLASTRPRTRRRPDGAVDMRQFGHTPMATGRCTPQLGQLTVGTRSPLTS